MRTADRRIPKECHPVAIDRRVSAVTPLFSVKTLCQGCLAHGQLSHYTLELLGMEDSGITEVFEFGSDIVERAVDSCFVAHFPIGYAQYLSSSQCSNQCALDHCVIFKRCLVGLMDGR